MGENSAISWTDHTFSPWWGCVKVSPGCKNCYAADMAARFGQGWTPSSERRFVGEAQWALPRRWNRAAERAGRRAFVFCASMADIFEDVPEHVREQTEAARVRLWALIAETPWLVWLLLTKRPERVAQVVPASWMAGAWPSNVWIGCTVEDEEHAAKRLPHLLTLPAPRRFVSYEPALGPVDWWPWFSVTDGNGEPSGPRCNQDGSPAISWLIIGGESGAKARPFSIQWARDTIAQCREARVPVWMKQLGFRASDPVAGIAGAGLDVPDVAEPLVSRRLRDRAGADPAEWAADLRVQERPEPEAVR